jgi:hypothetical protein
LQQLDLNKMKRFYFLLIIIGLYSAASAQTEGASKIYGYKQRVKPGTIRVDDNGREVQAKPVYNYFIYLASTTKVIPVEIWINGEVYSVTINTVPATPVKYTNPMLDDNKSEILVPKTTRKVLQLAPSTDKIQKPTQKAKTLSAKNELVIIYKGSGKTYYKALLKLKELEPLAMQ